MQQASLTLVRGDDQDVGVIVAQPDGSYYNLSGATLIFTARTTSYCSDILLQKVITSHYGAVSGYSLIPFLSGDFTGIDSNQHYYDIKLLSVADKQSTLVYGPFLVYP